MCSPIYLLCERENAYHAPRSRYCIIFASRVRSSVLRRRRSVWWFVGGGSGAHVCNLARSACANIMLAHVCVSDAENCQIIRALPNNAPAIFWTKNLEQSQSYTPCAAAQSTLWDSLCALTQIFCQRQLHKARALLLSETCVYTTTHIYMVQCFCTVYIFVPVHVYISYVYVGGIIVYKMRTEPSSVTRKSDANVATETRAHARFSRADNNSRC